MLASMRLCANVPAQHAIQTALGGYQSISEFITPGGRLYEQRNRAWELINDIPGRFLRETSWCAVYVPENRRQTL
ncbi:putative aminotransferase [Escherichia coli]|uniref:Putative aminotransferase n=1 Tax=Escherichia coli TaxID=562 RepID=A0A376WX82_ECOLX|nr:putative aminotransferase [Escherichia coli]